MIHIADRPKIDFKVKSLSVNIVLWMRNGRRPSICQRTGRHFSKFGIKPVGCRHRRAEGDIGGCGDHLGPEFREHELPVDRPSHDRTGPWTFHSQSGIHLDAKSGDGLAKNPCGDSIGVVHDRSSENRRCLLRQQPVARPPVKHACRRAEIENRQWFPASSQ